MEPDLPHSFFSTIGGRREALPADAPGVAIRYAVAVALAVLGVVITATVGDLAEEAPYLISISVVMVVSWFGGFGPGVVASALSALGVDYFATAPLHTLTILDRDNLVLVGAFLTATWLISWLNAARLRAEAEGETLLRQEQDARREAIAGRNRMSFLAEASAVLAVSLDYRATLRQVAHLVVPTLADWCAVHIVGEDGEVSQLEVAHVDPSKVEWVRRLEERYPPDPNVTTGVHQVVRTGKPELYAEITDEMLYAVARDAEHLAALRSVGMTSALVVPMTARGRVLGALTFVSTGAERRYGQDDLELAEIVARRCAQAIDNARLFREMRAAEARYRGLFEGTAEAVLVISPEGRLLDANAAATKLLGYSREELRQLPASQLAASHPAWLEAGRPDFTREGGWRGELELRRQDGTTVPAEGQGRAVDLPTGTVHVVTWRDVSERHELDRLQQAFLASVSHDLKNPLAAAKATTQLARRRLRRGDAIAPDEMNRSLAAIEEALGRTGALLDELSDVARTRLGQTLDLSLGRVDLVALVERSADEHQRATDRHRITVEAECPEIVGQWDAARIRRVVDNLLANAVKYSPDGGPVEVRIGIEAEPDGRRWARLTVRDQGVGIPADDLPHLFTRYYRGTNVLGRFGGTGMGLAGARQILEQHGGSIGVESAEGAGSTFTVRLPLEEAPDLHAWIKAAAGDTAAVSGSPG